MEEILVGIHLWPSDIFAGIASVAVFGNINEMSCTFLDSNVSVKPPDSMNGTSCLLKLSKVVLNLSSVGDLVGVAGRHTGLGVADT